MYYFNKIVNKCNFIQINAEYKIDTGYYLSNKIIFIDLVVA